MKIRCIKTKLGEEFPFPASRDHSHYLNIGDEFIVYGLAFNRNSRFNVFIIWDDRLISPPIDLFEIIDNRIPDFWKVDLGVWGSVMIGPELLLKDDFLENLFEREPKERKEFEELRLLYEKEE